MFLDSIRRSIWVWALAASLASQAVVGAQDGDVVADGESPEDAEVEPVGVEAFMMIAERNVFNARRTRRVERVERPVIEQRREPRVDSFALTGIIQYERGSFAFFDGTSPEFRKAVKPGDEIGDYSVAFVTPEEVVLEREGSATKMAVGEQLRREDDGEWQLSKQTGSFGSRGGGSASGSRSGFGDRPRDGEARDADQGGRDDGDAGGASDILKRLMEQRRKEMNQ